MANAALEVENLTVRYGNLEALSGVSFRVPEGAYAGIVGPNGGGKTTLLRAVLGLEKPSSGKVRLFGRDAADFGERHWIGYVPQRIAQADFPATVLEVVGSGRSSRCSGGHLAPEKDRGAVWGSLERCGIAHLAERRIGDLSGGQRQRAFIARALAGNPRMLVLDEPTTGVDAGSRERFYALLRDLNRNSRITVLSVSHDLDALAREAGTIFHVDKTISEVSASGEPGTVAPSDVPHLCGCGRNHA